MYDWLDVWMDMDGWTDKQLDGWTDGLADRDRQMKWRSEFKNKH